MKSIPKVSLARVMFLWDNVAYSSIKAMMGTSKPWRLSANPEIVRAGPAKGTENPPGAAI
jgi:hypothetical protein